LFNFLLKFLR